MVTTRTFLTVTAAAMRVERSPRQVERWIRDGLPVYTFEGKRKRYVLESELLTVFRGALASRSKYGRHADGV